jgi:hypothetical protein
VLNDQERAVLSDNKVLKPVRLWWDNEERLRELEVRRKKLGVRKGVWYGSLGGGKVEDVGPGKKRRVDVLGAVGRGNTRIEEGVTAETDPGEMNETEVGVASEGVELVAEETTDPEAVGDEAALVSEMGSAEADSVEAVAVSELEMLDQDQVTDPEAIPQGLVEATSETRSAERGAADGSSNVTAEIKEKETPESNVSEDLLSAREANGEETAAKGSSITINDGPGEEEATETEGIGKEKSSNLIDQQDAINEAIRLKKEIDEDNRHLLGSIKRAAEWLAGRQVSFSFSILQ